MPRPLDPEVRTAILADIKAGGKSCRGIARDHGVSDATVRKIAKDNQVVNAFSRAQTENATRARVADMAAQRAEKSALLLADVDRLRERAWSPYQVVVNTSEGPEIVTLKLPPLRDTQAAYTSIGIAIDKHLAIERHDSGTGAEQAASLLGTLLDNLQARHGTAPE